MAVTTFERFDETIERQMRNGDETLSEKDQRRFAASQARQLGHGGIGYISEVLGCSKKTIGCGIGRATRRSGRRTNSPSRRRSKKK